MTASRIDPALLPPVAWQRGTSWGRDVTAYAREQDHRITDEQIVSAFEMTSPDLTTVGAIVVTSRYRDVLGSLEFSVLNANRKMTPEQWDKMLMGRRHEIDIATTVCTFIMDGSRIISLGPELVAQAEADPASDIAMDVIKRGGPGFYVHTEGTTSLSYDGKPLDGIFVSFEEDDEGDFELHLTPMTRDNPPVDTMRTPMPTVIAKPSKNNITVSDCIRSAAKAMDIKLASVSLEFDKYLKDEEAEPEAEDATSENKKISYQLRKKVALLEVKEVSKQTAIMLQEADRWARLIGMSLNCLVNRGPEGISGFQPEAPADLVERVAKGGAGARKAEQRLVALGYHRWTRYEIGQGTDSDSENDLDNQQQSESEVQQSSTEIPDAPLKDDEASASKQIAEKVKRSSRKERRIERINAKQIAAQQRQERGEFPVENMISKPKTAEPSKPEPTQENTNNAKNIVAGIPVHDPDLLDHIDETLRRCFKDVPSIDTRNWEASFASAVAAMVMRRARVAQMPRETLDATRRRLSADIRPRLDQLPTLLHGIRAEEENNADKMRAYRIEKSSIMRDVEEDVAEAAIHPIVVAVADDDDLAQRIMFAGVEREPAYLQDRTIIVRAWLTERTLHLMGIVHDGCLTGFRRVEYDLDRQQSTIFDADADDGDADALLDALYAPIADVVLGPVDELDAWQHQRRRDFNPKKTVERTQPDFSGIDPENEKSDADKPDKTDADDWNLVSSDFESWETIKRPCGTLTPSALAIVSELMDQNSVARAALRTLEHESEREESREVRSAFTRHLLSLSDATNARIDATIAPDIQDEADLSKVENLDGVLVITDRALVEQASPGIISGLQVNRETPVCVLYRVRPEGITALLIQPTADNLINLAQWTRFSAVSEEDESDLSWYLRGAIANVICPSKISTPSNIRTDAVALPTIPKALKRESGKREGPRRIVAQARFKPQNMQLATAAAASWFDAQIIRHGDALVEDRRSQGEWTIEHESNDRGNSSRWSVTLNVADDDPTALDLRVRTTLATGVKPRLPTLIREIASATPTEGPDGTLLVYPPSVRMRSDLNKLLRHLQSPDRQLPTLIMTQDKMGHYARDPVEIAKQSLGAMNVWLIAHHMTYELTDTLGQEYRVFGGACRLFQPRFDPDTDLASRHPRIMNDSSAERTLSDIISRATAATITRYNIPDVDVVDIDTTDATVTPKSDPILTSDRKSEKTADVAPELKDVAVIQLQSEKTVGKSSAETAKTVSEENISDHVQTDTPDEIQDKIEEPQIERVDPEATHEPIKPQEPVEETQPSETSQNPVDVELISRVIDSVIGKRLDEIGLKDLVTTVASLSDRVAEIANGIASAPVSTNKDVSKRDREIQRLREEMRDERESAQELLSEAESARQAAVDEVEILRQAFNERRRGEIRGKQALQWPADISGLAEWLETNVLPNVIITAKAWRAMRKVRYTDMERLCSTLQLMDGAYIDMRDGEDGARQRWEDGLKELRLENRKQSQNGKGIRGGNEYRFEHDGQRWDMDFHLRGIESVYNDHERLLRIYYSYDKERGRVLIGHMPTHLTTIDS